MVDINHSLQVVEQKTVEFYEDELEVSLKTRLIGSTTGYSP